MKGHEEIPPGQKAGRARVEKEEEKKGGFASRRCLVCHVEGFSLSGCPVVVGVYVYIGVVSFWVFGVDAAGSWPLSIKRPRLQGAQRTRRGEESVRQ